MDDRTGQIYTSEEIAERKKKLEEMFGKLRAEDEMKHMREMLIPPTQKQMSRVPPKVGRNEPCPCGSGKKFKNCCLSMESRDI